MDIAKYILPICLIVQLTSVLLAMNSEQIFTTDSQPLAAQYERANKRMRKVKHGLKRTESQLNKYGISSKSLHIASLMQPDSHELVLKLAKKERRYYKLMAGKSAIVLQMYEELLPQSSIIPLLEQNLDTLLDLIEKAEEKEAEIKAYSFLDKTTKN